MEKGLAYSDEGRDEPSKPVVRRLPLQSNGLLYPRRRAFSEKRFRRKSLRRKNPASKSDLQIKKS
jgi:hypothetical protein